MLTNVIMLTPAPRVMVTALVEGSIALAVTGTDGTAVHCHSGLGGWLWILGVGGCDQVGGGDQGQEVGGSNEWV